MASNKFATMLHNKTNRITLILAYAILEWILIVLLLFNSLFSYLIIKFANYFGLKQPCLWCTRIDHIFDPSSKYKISYRDLVCDDHANEISKLGYCSNHRKLAKSLDMCEDCCDSSKKLASFPWMKQFGLIQDDGDKVVESGGESFKCSCCGVMLEKNWDFSCLLIKPSWEVLNYPQKGDLIAEEAEGIDDIADYSNASDGIKSDSVADYQVDEQRFEESKRVAIVSDADAEGVKEEELEKEEFSCFISSFDCKQMVAYEDDHKYDAVREKEKDQEEREKLEKEEFSCFISSFDCNQTVANEDDHKDDVAVREKDLVVMEEEGDINVTMDNNQLLAQLPCSSKEESPKVQPKHLEFFIEGDDCHLIPVELMNSTSVKRKRRMHKFREEDEGFSTNGGDVILDFDLHSPAAELLVKNRCSSRKRVTLLSVLHENEEEDEQDASSSQAYEAADVQELAATTGEREMDAHVNPVSDEQNDESEAVISIGTDIPDNETIEDIQMQLLYGCTQEDPSTTSSQLHKDTDHGSYNAEEETIRFKTITVETCDKEIKNHLASLCLDLNEIGEDRVPDTPTSSIDSLHLLHKRLSLPDRRESATEDSFDGSVFGDIEGADGVLTVEKLKSALKAERKALNALYTEHEEERSVSAVAANETMAMMNRLQEEKAAMQMDALQFQRMMEEQSEYDQEALQLSNELLVENRCSSREKVTLLSVHHENEEKTKVESSESNVKKEWFFLTHTNEEEDEQVASSTQLYEAGDVQEMAAASREREMVVQVNPVSDEQIDENEAQISIGTDIPDHEPIDDIQMQHLYECTQEDPSATSSQLHTDADHGSNNAEEETIQFKTIMVETCDQATKNHCTELNVNGEDKVPDTPASIDSLHLQHKKLLLFDRRESATEDSLDGSVFGDIEGADGVLTVEKLKSALKAERKALNALYTELEEERSASAVAANQTMAMINRLQEEKAAMQMEALQYQRMMEEQSEYDQEALQLLNELMVKREKEKAEIEKELEIYRKRVQDYEAKEKMIMMRRRKDDSNRSATSASCSHTDQDSDGLSVDLNHEPKDEDSDENHQEGSDHNNTPAAAVVCLEESLASFEEERLSILEQLKVLEEKLVSLNDDEEEQHFKDMKSVENSYEENGNGFHSSYETNGHFIHHHHQERKHMAAAKAKRLLPLFDATDAEIEDGISNGHENGFNSVPSPTHSEIESKKLAIEGEVDHVYERLQALEADREFLKHCISSISKGDKGIYLLKEILRHLRDLRSVELRVRNMGDAAIWSH